MVAAKAGGAKNPRSWEELAHGTVPQRALGQDDRRRRPEVTLGSLPIARAQAERGQFGACFRVTTDYGNGGCDEYLTLGGNSTRTY